MFSFLFRNVFFMIMPESPTWLTCGLQSPNRFEEVFEEMICFLEQTDHWENTEMELSARGVREILWFTSLTDLSGKPL